MKMTVVNLYLLNCVEWSFSCLGHLELSYSSYRLHFKEDWVLYSQRKPMELSRGIFMRIDQWLFVSERLNPDVLGDFGNSGMHFSYLDVAGASEARLQMFYGVCAQYFCRWHFLKIQIVASPTRRGHFSILHKVKFYITSDISSHFEIFWFGKLNIFADFKMKTITILMTS